MRILCTNRSLTDRAGSESYLETITDELLRLGHEVVVWAPASRHGIMAERLAALGCAVKTDLSDIGPVDVVHAQHASTAPAARAHFPETPLVFASHSWAFDIEDPPVEARPGALIAFNDPVMARLRASRTGEDVPVYRLRQPVSLSAFDGERIPISETPLFGVAVDRGLVSRASLLQAACERMAIHLDIFNSKNPLEDPTVAMMRADIVFAVGRTALEAMALGRATFILDETGMAGFVTADRYPELEACGFTPAPGPSMTIETLLAELERYDPQMGPLGRELTARHHAAREHVSRLVEIYRSVPSHRPVCTITTALGHEQGQLVERLHQYESRDRRAQWELARSAREAIALDRHARAVQARADEMERRAVEQEARAEQLEAERGLILRSTSWRLTRPLRALGRRRRRRSGPTE